MRDRLVLVDISTKKFKSISYKQYDVNNLLQIVVMENKSIVDISNYIATIYFEMPSGNVYQINGKIDNNTINVLLSSQVLSEHGQVMVEVELVNLNQIVTTFTFYLNIEKSINKGGASINTDHIHLNKDILDQITQEMIDSILAGGGLVDLSIYQTKRDTNLDTTDKTIIGAINELNEKIENGSIGGGSCTCDKHTHDNKVILDGITQAKINEWDSAEENVQVDWNETDTTSDTYIKNKPSIPSKVSELTNDSGYATETYVTEEIAKASTGGTVDLSNYQTKSDNVLATTDKTVVGAINELKTNIDNIDVPTKTSDLTNDSGFLTDIPSEYITETELDAKNYIDETELNAKGYAIKTEVDTALSDKVDVEVGKGLSTNDFTDNLKTKLEGIEERAEVNVQSDWNITDTSNDAYIKNKPNLTTYATKSFVSEEIAKAVTGGTVDLSGYATKDELNTKANVDHTHTMSNITDLVIPDVDKAYVDTQLNTKANKSDIPSLDGYALKTDIPTVPTKVSDLTNDSGFITEVPSEYITETELNAKGYLTEHQDISNKADKSEIPTKTSQLTNDSNFLTEHQNISGKADKSYVDTELAKKSNTNHTHDQYLTEHQDLSDYVLKTELPSVPTKTSQLTNDSGFITSIPSEYITETELNAKGYLTEHQDLSNYALKTEIPTVPTKTSQLTNDAGYITSIPSEYITETELNAKGYLTEHQDISGKADKTEIPTKTSQLTNDSGYVSNTSVDEKVAAAFTNQIPEANILSIVLGNYQIKYNSTDDTLDFLYNGVIDKPGVQPTPDNYVTEGLSLYIDAQDVATQGSVRDITGKQNITNNGVSTTLDNNCLNFVASESDYIDCGFKPNLTQWSAEIYFYFTATPTSAETLLGWGGSGNRTAIASWDSFMIAINDDVQYTITSIPPTSLTHLVLTYNNGTIIAYVNRVKSQLTTNANVMSSQASNLMVGTKYSHSGEFANIHLKLLRFYDGKVLTDEEVLQNYNYEINRG